jgi:hypothetical protein
MRNWKNFNDLKFKIQLFELFDYLIWCDTKIVEIKMKFGLKNWVLFSYLNWFCKKELIIWIDFVKKNWIKGDSLSQKLNIWNIL